MTPSKTVVPEPMGLLELVGADLGVSAPRTVSQSEVDAFADLTGDHQWIHVDTERAKSGPFGSTIVHGFFTLALVPLMFGETLEISETSMGVNYGLDKVRFIAPLRPDEEVRARATLTSAEALPEGAGVHAAARVAVERVEDGQLCCVADIVFRYYV
ncbi:MaoC family dehydratase [Nocardioides dubius]|uniref:MaoC family dehydratase n=1 Tax=Nocardioides dubius TaxID=317019 RepID=A0ABP4EIU6_9ACTN